MNLYLFILLSLPVLTYAWMMFGLRQYLQPWNSETEYQRIENLTIVIPCRNEDKNIINCLNALELNQRADDHFEVLVVDDHSVDSTVEQLSRYKGKLNVKILKNISTGKKETLLTGIQAADNDTIMTIDADSKPSEVAVRAMLNIFRKGDLNMLCGLVSVEPGNSVFGYFQQAESAAVVGISAAMLNSGKPATCNGSNLMFSRSAFLDAGAYLPEAGISSGDDDLLMQRMYRMNPEKVGYTLHPDAVVYTSAAPDFTSFVHQRLRWVTKYPYYIYSWNRILQILVLAHLVAFWFFAFTALSGNLFAMFVIILKWVSDLCFAVCLRKSLSFLSVLIILMPVYQLYILLLWPAKLILKAEWKGRKISD